MAELKDMTEPELFKLMKAIGDAVKAKLPPKTLFVVLAFDGDGLGQYISNANRTDIIAAMRETATRLEARQYVAREDFLEDGGLPNVQQ